MDFKTATVKEIQQYLNQRHYQLSDTAIRLLETDGRRQVQKLGAKCRREIERIEAEKKRLSLLRVYETKLALEGFSKIAGIDEAGRGPLAGPVVAAAVILPENLFLDGLQDSKRLTASDRERLAGEIKACCISWGIGVASPAEIDSINILQATKLAMKRAVAALSVVPDHLLIDAVQLGSKIPETPVIKGDARSASIAAASVVAKVTRDYIMLKLDKKYPQYGFARHKGYPTRDHYTALQKYGPSPVHRLTFRGVSGAQ